MELDGGGAVETDDRRALIVGAVDFALERQVDRWNTRAEEGCAMRELGRADIVQLWKRSNTRGGSFVMKKMNYIIGATLSYKREIGELTISLNVVEGEEPTD